MNARGCALPRMYSISPALSRVPICTALAPSRGSACSTTRYSTQFGSMRATRTPGPTPSEARA